MPDFPLNRFSARKKAIQTQFRHDHLLCLFVFCPFPAVLAEFGRTGTTPACIFRQAAIADLAVAKDLFDVPERMFHLGPGTGFELFGSQLTQVQILSSAGALGNEPEDVLRSLCSSRF
jgi:hypothetical protein